MKFLALATLTIVASLSFSLTASANDAPPAAPPGQTAQTPPLQPPVNPPVTPPALTEARKEEEAEKAKASLLTRLKAYCKGQNGMANDLTALQQENTDLKAQLKAFQDGTAVKALQDQNAAMRKDLEDFAAFAQTHGLLTENPAKPPAPASPGGQIAGQAVAAAVSAQLAGLGITLTALPAANAPSGTAASIEDVEAQLKACKTPAERQEILTKNHALIMRSN